MPDNHERLGDHDEKLLVRGETLFQLVDMSLVVAIVEPSAVYRRSGRSSAWLLGKNAKRMITANC